MGNRSEGNTGDGDGGDGDAGGLCKRYAISNKWRNRERKRDRGCRPLWMPLVKFTSHAAVNLPVEIPQRNEGRQLSSVAFRGVGGIAVSSRRKGDDRRGKYDEENPAEARFSTWISRRNASRFIPED